MDRIRWICDACEAVHHYIPVKCCRCGEKTEKKNTTFNNLMEELEKWQITDKTDKKE